MTIVMYHYVRHDNSEYPYFNSLNITMFKKQLDYFQANYKMLTQEEYFTAIDNGANPDGVVLTFDDGLKDHYTNVLPELQVRNLWGLFYISTEVYSSCKLLGVHRIHHLKGKYGASVILKEALKLITDSMLDEDTISEFDKEIYTYSNYDDDEKKLRRMFNYYIKYEHRDIILDGLMNKYFEESILHSQTYLTPYEINAIHKSGNIIGSHTVSHKVLSRLTYDQQYSEIKNSFEYLKSVTKLPKLSFCYPFGYKSSYNTDTLKILDELNIHNAVIFDNAVQTDPVNRYELSRIDCNKFMGI